MPVSESIAIKVTGLILFYALAATEAGAAAAAVAEQTIMGDATLRLYCIIGSVTGAILAVTVFLPSSDGDSKQFIRNLAVKFASSSAMGVLAGPFVIRYFGFAVDADMVIGISGAMAATGVWMLHIAMPLLERGVLVKVKSYLGFVDKASGE